MDLHNLATPNHKTKPTQPRERALELCSRESSHQRALSLDEPQGCHPSEVSDWLVKTVGKQMRRSSRHLIFYTGENMWKEQEFDFWFYSKPSKELRINLIRETDCEKISLRWDSADYRINTSLYYFSITK